MIDFASEAYRIGEKIENKRESMSGLRPEVFGYEIFSLCQNEEEDLCGMVAEKNKNLIVCFRGTASKKNINTDLRTSRIDISSEWDMNKSHPYIVKTKVHKGFWKAYSTVRHEMIEAVEKHWSREMGHVMLTGHSLGGALSILMAFELKTRYQIPVEVYVFGCPRVGNYRFSEVFNHNIPKCFRVCMDGDVVTGLPIWGFKHVGTSAIVDRLGNLIVSPSSMEASLISSSRRRFRCHKMTHYRHSVNAALKIDRRLGLLTDDGADLKGKPEQKYMFKNERLCLSYGLASVLPLTALNENVLCSDSIPKPIADFPSLMLAVDDTVDRQLSAVSDDLAGQFSEYFGSISDSETESFVS